MGHLTRWTEPSRIVGIMKPIVLAFAGAIRSGKSELSSGVAGTLGWARVSFGDYVREVAQQRGLDSTREALQAIGVSLIAEGWEQFCRSVLSQAHWQAGQPMSLGEPIKPANLPSSSAICFALSCVGRALSSTYSRWTENRRIPVLSTSVTTIWQGT